MDDKPVIIEQAANYDVVISSSLGVCQVKISDGIPTPTLERNGVRFVVRNAKLAAPVPRAIREIAKHMLGYGGHSGTADFISKYVQAIDDGADAEMRLAEARHGVYL